MKHIPLFFAAISILLLAGCGSSTTTTAPTAATAPAKTVYTAPDNTFQIKAEGKIDITHEDSVSSYTWDQERTMVAVISEAFTPEEAAEFTPQKILDTTASEVTNNLNPDSVVKTPMTYHGQPAFRIKGTITQDNKDQYYDMIAVFEKNHGYRIGMNSLDPISDAQAQAVYDSFSTLPQ